VVLNSDVREEDAAEIVRLRREKAEAEGRLRDREMRVSELEDENRQLKNIPRPPLPRRDETPNTFFG
jgi:chromosome segregation ATPase